MVVDCRICGDPHSVGSHSLSSLVKLLYLHMGARAALNLLTSSPCSSWQRKDHQLPSATLAQVKSEDGETTDRRKVLQMVLRGLMAMTWRSRSSFGQCFMAQSTNGVKTANPESKILNDSYLELPLHLFLGCSSMLGGSSSRVEMDHALVTSSPISMFLIFLCNESYIKTAVCAVHAFNIENER
ncbi:hypothetical protein TRIUR3_29929 [Triticum urartu]|uniref:Uncharacterized protein n=1 Tax=Triticum urartu TaxID=4572 RepID=M8A9G1_TRIUA|nr:hypothetical protein TRIUR3_29929 [Triticum urartu]